MSTTRTTQRDTPGGPLSSPRASFAVSAFQEPYLFEVNRSTFEQRQSSEVFARHFGDALRRTDSLYVVVGSDSGLLIRYLLDQGLPAGSRFLFVEPPEVATLVSTLIPDAVADERIAVATTETWERWLETFSVRNYIYLGNLSLHRSVGGSDLFLPAYADIYQHIHQRITAIEWSVQAQLGHKDFFRHQLANLAENRFPAIALENGFTGQVAMILAGGPSLDEFLPWATENRDRVTLVAVSRISRRLLDHGLQPHIVVSVDPKPLSYHISRHMLLFDPEQVVFAHNYHVSPFLPAQWGGRSVYMGDLLPWDSRLNPPNLGDTGPTVTNTAINLALHMGFSRIILAGVDLCLSREGHSHAAGSRERGAGPIVTDTELSVVTNGGWQAETRPDFFSALQNLAAQAETARLQGRELINPAAGAARVSGIAHQPIGQVPLPAARDTPQARLFGLLPEGSAQERLDHYRRLTKELTRAEGRLHRIGHLAAEALKCNEDLFGRRGKPADFKYKKRMDRIERQLDRGFRDLAPLVKKYDVRGFLRLALPDRDREWTDQEIEDWGRTYYQTYRESAAELAGLVKAALGILRLRQREERQEVRLDELLPHWIEASIPARAMVWRRNRERAGLAIPEAERKRLQGFGAACRAQLEQELPGDWTVKGSVRDHRTVRGKIQRLFRARDRAGLERLDSLLARGGLPDGDGRRRLLKGYLAEVAEDVREALDAYQGILDTYQAEPDAESGDSLLEETLLRIAAITMEQRDLDNAAAALECLSNLSPVYGRQYGELLRILGQREQAIQALSRYVRAAPGDSLTLLRLGRLYRESGADQSARFAWEHVLSRDPGNAEARALLAELAPG